MGKFSVKGRGRVKVGWDVIVGVALLLTVVVSVAVLFFSGRVVVVTVGDAGEEFVVHPVIADVVANLTLRVCGVTNFSRCLSLDAAFVHVFYAEERGDVAFALVGVEDADDGVEPDGWSDVLLPVFYSKAANRGNVDYPIVFIDAAFSGSYGKELWLRTGNGSELLFVYSVESGLRERGRGERVSVGYVEYDPVKDVVYMPAHELDS